MYLCATDRLLHKVLIVPRSVAMIRQSDLEFSVVRDFLSRGHLDTLVHLLKFLIPMPKIDSAGRAPLGAVRRRP